MTKNFCDSCGVEVFTDYIPFGWKETNLEYLGRYFPKTYIHLCDSCRKRMNKFCSEFFTNPKVLEDLSK